MNEFTGGAPKEEQSKEYVDLSEKFRSMSFSDFRKELNNLRDVPHLKIDVDFTGEEKQSFIFKARHLKAFVEDARDGQKRDVIVRLRREQISWEPNVFSSGVEYVCID